MIFYYKSFTKNVGAILKKMAIFSQGNALCPVENPFIKVFPIINSFIRGFPNFLFIKGWGRS